MQRPDGIPNIVIQELKRYEGLLWKEVQGELHIQYGEIPIWILLYHDSNIFHAHSQFYQTVSKYFDAVSPLNFTVQYIILSDGVEYSLEFLIDNAEITRRVGDETLGAIPDQRPMPSESVFASKNSDRDEIATPPR